MAEEPKTSNDENSGLRPTSDSAGGGGSNPSGGQGFTGSSPPALASDVPAPPSPYDYYPDQLTLYGIKLNPTKSEVRLPIGDKMLDLRVYAKPPINPLPPDSVSIAVVYGYSFEGHCYRHEKPKMFIIEDSGQTANGCGFTDPYFMWRMRARTSIMELALSYDLAEVLVLNANLPGNRTPNTYGNHMMLAHRNGKLNRPGGA